MAFCLPVKLWLTLGVENDSQIFRRQQVRARLLIDGIPHNGLLNSERRTRIKSRNELGGKKRKAFVLCSPLIVREVGASRIPNEVASSLFRSVFSFVGSFVRSFPSIPADDATERRLRDGETHRQTDRRTHRSSVGPSVRLPRRQEDECVASHPTRPGAAR